MDGKASFEMVDNRSKSVVPQSHVGSFYSHLQKNLCCLYSFSRQAAVGFCKKNLRAAIVCAYQKYIINLPALSLDNEQLARSGVNCLENLVVSNGQRFTDNVWAMTCDCIKEIFDASLPQQLLTWRPDGQTEAVQSDGQSSANTPKVCLGLLVLALCSNILYVLQDLLPLIYADIYIN